MFNLSTDKDIMCTYMAYLPSAYRNLSKTLLIWH